MSNHGLTKENLLRSLPISLAGDPKMVALAGAIAGVLAKRLEEISRVSIYPHIDRLNEGVLDILARDFKVDWWDSDYSLDEKRRTMAIYKCHLNFFDRIIAPLSITKYSISIESMVTPS